MAKYHGHLTKKVIDRVLADYVGDPLRELSFRRQGGGGTWRRQSIPERRETIKTTTSKRGPAEGLGNHFGEGSETSTRPHDFGRRRAAATAAGGHRRSPNSRP